MCFVAPKDLIFMIFTPPHYVSTVKWYSKLSLCDSPNCAGPTANLFRFSGRVPGLALLQERYDLLTSKFQIVPKLSASARSLSVSPGTIRLKFFPPSWFQSEMPPTSISGTTKNNGQKSFEKHNGHNSLHQIWPYLIEICLCHNQ